VPLGQVFDGTAQPAWFHSPRFSVAPAMGNTLPLRFVPDDER
jgi:hypothetical protein